MQRKSSIRRVSQPEFVDEQPDTVENTGPRGPIPVGRSLEIATTPDVCMELLVEKLKLLEYEKLFCRYKKPFRKLLTWTFFAAPLPSGNSSEQFVYFSALCAWLLKQAGIDFSTPKEFDDPSAVTNSILTALKRMGFAPPTYPPSALRAGYGKEVLGVLDGLVDYVLEVQHVVIRRPIYQPDGYSHDGGPEEEDVTGDMEGTAYIIEAAADGDDEEDEFYLNTHGPTTQAGAAPTEAPEKQILISKVDPTLWKMEVERVAPKLRITLNSDNRDWQTHLDTAHQHKDQMKGVWTEGKAQLERLSQDVSASLDKLSTRERYLAEQCEHLMTQFRALQQQLSFLQETYTKRTETMSQRNNELHRIQEQLKELKESMDEHGSNLSDASPLVRIKNAMKSISQELRAMEVRIGVVSHTLLHLHLSDKAQQAAAAAAAAQDVYQHWN